MGFSSFENNPLSSPARMTLFHPLGRKLIKPNVYLVASLKEDGKVSIAQQLEVEAGTKPMHLFLKNAIEVEPEALYIIRDLLDEAIKALFEEGGLKGKKG